MTIVVGLALLLLTVAILVLFAMMGELYARQVAEPAADDHSEPLDGAHLGEAPASWPRELAEVRSAAEAHLIVLSTACATCAVVGRGLGSREGQLLPRPSGLIISTSDEQRAQDFLQECGLENREDCFVDLEGRWVTAAFGVQTSPAVLLLDEGRLVTATAVTSLKALDQVTARKVHTR